MAVIAVNPGVDTGRTPYYAYVSVGDTIESISPDRHGIYTNGVAMVFFSVLHRFHFHGVAMVFFLASDTVFTPISADCI